MDWVSSLIKASALLVVLVGSVSSSAPCSAQEAIDHRTPQGEISAGGFFGGFVWFIPNIGGTVGCGVSILEVDGKRGIRTDLVLDARLQVEATATIPLLFGARLFADFGRFGIYVVARGGPNIGLRPFAAHPRATAGYGFEIQNDTLASFFFENNVQLYPGVFENSCSDDVPDCHVSVPLEFHFGVRFRPPRRWKGGE